MNICTYIICDELSGTFLFTVGMYLIIVIAAFISKRRDTKNDRISKG